MTFAVSDLDSTLAWGKSLGPLLFPGAVVALVGQLGAGKTTFTRAVAEGLRVKNLSAVNSPTFTLIHEYAARIPIYHFDAYRLSTLAQFEGLGLDEYFSGTGVCIVEWADKFPESLPDQQLQIEMKRIDEFRREWTVIAFGERYETLRADWLKANGIASAIEGKITHRLETGATQELP